ncbi:MAG: zinc-binding alcohol dehydrogenase [gamma proteobacterium symbiont of Clathrolucina costata]
MPNWLISILGAIYTRIPVSIRPYVKRVFNWGVLRIQAIVSRRRVHQGQQVQFLDFEIAHLEPYEFLSPSNGEVLIKAQFSCISPGTERAVLCGLPGARRDFPYAPGYAVAGRLLAAGKGVGNLKVGDRVAGRMPHADLATVSARHLFKIPHQVTDQEACFIELGIICLQGIRKAGIQPGDVVAVVGQGLIGQLANRLAKMLGAARVVAIAPSHNREKTALLPGGADEFLAFNDDDVSLADVQADIVIEAVGSPDANLTALECAKDKGRVVLLGSTRGLTRNLNLAGLVQRRELTIVGAHINAMPEHDAGSQRWTYWQEGRLFLDLLANQRLSVADLITWQAAPTECNAVYENLAQGGRGQVGVVFDWRDSNTSKSAA